VLPVPWIVPGAHAANKNLKDFCSQRLQKYAALRNDPNTNYLSHLSPYLHFGQLSAQRVALAVQHADAERESKDAYLEELIVRRELADNFCLYNKNYDKVAGAHAWAQKTIAEHVSDIREFIYTPDEFEKAQTHDELWNAAQLQMAKEGKMHGFMRMYWAKKILEWSPDVQTAIDIALYLNDKYELDGTDPNGVVGVMWSICGVHDRAWTERSIFGKVRYMNYSGCKRKFDVQAYIDRYTSSSTLF
jgi:deoxyribodipyrimidine photo-lyase